MLNSLGLKIDYILEMRTDKHTNILTSRTTIAAKTTSKSFTVSLVPTTSVRMHGKVPTTQNSIFLVEKIHNTVISLANSLTLLILT